METNYKGTNRLIVGIVFGVITFWLFAQTMLNIGPAVQADLGISSSVLNIAISLTGLFSGMFMVGSGAMADKLGRVKLTKIGLVLSIKNELEKIKNISFAISPDIYASLSMKPNFLTSACFSSCLLASIISLPPFHLNNEIISQ